jgi:hypothetical protein
VANDRHDLLPTTRGKKPGISPAQIIAAFHKTAWSQPSVHIQPEGNVTLVTLPTYFEVKWPAVGYKPGEIDTVTLLGTPVRIRPTARNYNYVFGDGTTSGTTTSPGGTYPDGDVTHAYAKRGRYKSRIDITYGGEYSISGGAWIPIPDTVTIRGQPQTLTVKTAHARLVSKWSEGHAWSPGRPSRRAGAGTAAQRRRATSARRRRDRCIDHRTRQVCCASLERRKYLLLGRHCRSIHSR